jgi:O-antigen/teichoic acid export membrane protein
MSEKEQISLKNQSAWLFFAKIIGFAFQTILPLLVVRFLTQDQFGIYQQVFKVLTNLVAILPLGFSLSAFYFLAREEEKKPFAIFNIMFFNFVMGGIAFLICFFQPQIIGNIFQSSEILKYIPLLGIGVWVWIFSQFLETVVLANQESKIATFFIVFAQFIKSLLMVVSVVFFTTVESLIYAAIIFGIIQSCLLIYYLNSRFPTFWKSFDWKFFREHAIYALPFGISGLVWVLQIEIHNYFIANRFLPAEYAIYAVGCFQLPLIGIIAESATNVLIPRMSELQLQDDKREMIELTSRVMQKLSFFYFPIYVFLMITAQTFITTLFTDKFSASVPIFMINLTLLPFYIWVTDPIARAFQEIGRFLFIYRIIFFVFLVSILWFAIQNFTLLGMIATVVITTLIELSIASAVVLYKVGVRFSDLYLLKNIGKTSLISLFAGFFTFLVYANTKGFLPIWDEKLAEFMRPSFSHFLAGCFVLGISALVYGIIYLIGANYFNLIDENEKQLVKSFITKLTKRGGNSVIANPQSQI